MGKKREPPAHTAFEHLAKQTDTKPDEWCHVTKSSSHYRKGYRYWHPATDQYAKMERGK